DRLIWEQHPENDRHREEVFQIFFKDALESGGAFVVIDTKTQQIIGSTRFHGYDPKKSDVEIGWTFLARKYWGGPYNREMKQLMLTHAFKFVRTLCSLSAKIIFVPRKRRKRSGLLKAVQRKRSMETVRRLST